MLRLSDTRNFAILISLFFSYCYDANSSSIATAIENQPQISVNQTCKISFNPLTSQLTLTSPITVNANSQRARCIIRINTSNTQRQFRLVPLALKGQVNKAPAQLAISSFLIGDLPTPYQSPLYGSSLKFDLTNKILPTKYTTKEKSVLGINLVLTTTGGELVLTDMKFALLQ